MTDNQCIKRAAGLLREGRLVAFPTETVYGLGADASNATAVRNIFAAKARPVTNPLIIHIADISQLEAYATDISMQARQLAAHFWPGPLTMILRKQAAVLDIVTGGQATVGIRVPRHPLAQALLREFGSGVAAPSANKFMHISPTDANAVRAELGDEVQLVLDGGDCEVGLESTIIDMSGDQPVILRPGMIHAAAIEAVLGMQLGTHSTQRAPGMHLLHYSPRTMTVLMDSNAIQSLLPAASTRVLRQTELGLDPSDYAHNLYRVLRELDNAQFARIIIEDVPHTSEWAAIRDRLTKACARDK